MRDGWGWVVTTLATKQASAPETEGLRTLHFQTGGGEARGESARVVGELGAQLAEPADGCFHFGP